MYIFVRVGDKYPIARNWCTSPTKIAEMGDILISVRAPVGEVNIASHKCCIGRGLSAITGTNADQNFLYWVMQFSALSLNKLSQGSTFTAINRKELADLIIPIPRIDEQKKIAEILAAVDLKIQAEQDANKKILVTKQALMQVLLTGKVRVALEH